MAMFREQVSTDKLTCSLTVLIYYRYQDEFILLHMSVTIIFNYQADIMENLFHCAHHAPIDLFFLCLSNNDKSNNDNNNHHN